MKPALRPLLVLAFALATLVSTQARAAVPMCSNDGRSVIAPPIVMPWRMLTLDAPKPCPQADSLLVQFLPEQQRRAPSEPPAPAPLRAVPLRTSELAAPARTRRPSVSPEIPTSRELGCSLYRPPRV